MSFKRNVLHNFITTRSMHLKTLKKHLPAISKYLEIPYQGGTRRIAVNRYKNDGNMNITFIPGFFMSCGASIECNFLQKFCEENSINFTSYDSCGLGESTVDVSLNNAKFSDWFKDAEEVLNITNSPQTVVGHSMGGWISVILAQKYPSKISNLVLLSPAIHFFPNFNKYIQSTFTPEEKEKFDKGEAIMAQNPALKNGEQFSFSRDFSEDALKHVIRDETLDIFCPVTIINGMKDKPVPYEGSLKLVNMLKSTDVTLTLVKDAGHELTRDTDLQLLANALKGINTNSNDNRNSNSKL